MELSKSLHTPLTDTSTLKLWFAPWHRRKLTLNLAPGIVCVVLASRLIRPTNLTVSPLLYRRGSRGLARLLSSLG